MSKPSDLILVCFALKEEAAPFQKMVSEAAAPAQTGVSILLTGMGRPNAEKSVREFLNSCRSRGNETQIKDQSETPYVVSCEPNLALTCGFAGGLNLDLKIGDVVFELSTRRDEFHESQIKTEIRDSQSLSLREKLLASGAKPAKMFCANRIATTAVEKKKLRDETGADAIEMESAAIQAVCRERGIPCATVRVISDTADEDLPLDFNALAKPDKNLDYGKLLLAIARSPGKIGALMELQKKTKFAAEQLARALAKIIAP